MLCNGEAVNSRRSVLFYLYPGENLALSPALIAPVGSVRIDSVSLLIHVTDQANRMND